MRAFASCSMSPTAGVTTNGYSGSPRPPEVFSTALSVPASESPRLRLQRGPAFASAQHSTSGVVAPRALGSKPAANHVGTLREDRGPSDEKGGAGFGCVLWPDSSRTPGALRRKAVAYGSQIAAASILPSRNAATNTSGDKSSTCAGCNLYASMRFERNRSEQVPRDVPSRLPSSQRTATSRPAPCGAPLPATMTFGARAHRGYGDDAEVIAIAALGNRQGWGQSQQEARSSSP